MSERVRAEEGKEIPLSWFGQTLWKYSPLYLELVFLAICLRLIGLVEPFVFQVIIDRILPFQREASLLVVMAIFIAVSLFQMGFQVLSALLGAMTANNVVREFGKRIFGHLFHLPLSHFRKWTVGETIARVSETDTIRSFIVGTSTGIFLDLLFVAIYLGILLALSPFLTLIVLISLPLQAAVYFAFGPFLRKRLRVQFDKGAAHQTQMVENISGIAAVKALSAEAEILDRLDKTLWDSLRASFAITKLNIASDQITFAVTQSVTIAIVFLGAAEVFSGAMTLGQLISFYMIAGMVAGPVANFSGLWESWQNVRVSRQRLGDIVNLEPEPFGRLPKLPEGVEPSLEFATVDFGYSPEYRLLRGFQGRFSANSLTLIVGPSGVGKSTFGRLASGIETPLGGTVTLGGQNIAQFDPYDVRRKIAYVPQEPYLFTGTIRENLLLGDQELIEEDIHWALRIAGADSLLAALPDGLETSVGERGMSLSGGQRQRIAIARSILLRPKVLILDEPTSALDAETQGRMARELAKLKSTMTLVIITHRAEAFEGVDAVLHLTSEGVA